MARVRRYLNSKLSSVDPYSITTVTLVSAAGQYLAFHFGVKEWVVHNFDTVKVAAHRTEHDTGKVTVGEAEVAKAMVEESFRRDADLHLALMQQMVGVGLMSHSVVQKTNLVATAVLTMGGGLAATYVAWAPIVRILALSAVIKDGHSSAYRHFPLFLSRQHDSEPVHIYYTLMLSSIAMVTAAMYTSLPKSLSIPLSVFYLAINFL